MRTSRLGLLLAGLLSCITSLAAAQDLDELLGGFEDMPEVERGSADAGALSSRWQNSGSFSLNTAYNYIDHYSESGTDYEGWSKTRLRINLQSDKDINDEWKLRLAGYAFYDPVYSARGRSRYSDEVLRELESDADVQELWIQGKLHPQVDLKAGRQVIIWGRSDNLRITDALNPLDSLEPGLADIEDIRLPVTMAALDFYIDNWNLALIWIPEIRFSKLPPQGSDFSFYQSLTVGESSSSSLPEIHDRKPDHISDSSYALSLGGIFSGWDISFYAARLWQDAPVVSDVDFNLLTSSIDALTLAHRRYSTLGSAASLAHGNWLMFYEIALLKDYNFNALRPSALLPGSPELLILEKDRIDVLIGTEYNGLTDTTISLEIANRHVRNYERSLHDFSVRENQMETALRYQRTFVRERWRLLALGLWFGEKAQYGAIYRVQLSYELTDDWDITGGLLRYHAGDTAPLNGYEDNDRVFIDVKYSF